MLLEIQSGRATLGNSLAVSYKIKRSLTIYDPATILLILKLMAQLIKELWPHKNLHVNVYNKLIHNLQKLEATQMSFNRWMTKQAGIATQ